MKTTKKINSGKVKLTSENISKGLVREKIRNMPVEDWTSYDDLMDGPGEEILISWCKTKLGNKRVAELEDAVQGYINIHNDTNLTPPKHLEVPANFSAKPVVTPDSTNKS